MVVMISRSTVVVELHAVCQPTKLGRRQISRSVARMFSGGARTYYSNDGTPVQAQLKKRRRTEAESDEPAAWTLGRLEVASIADLYRPKKKALDNAAGEALTARSRSRVSLARFKRIQLTVR